MIASIRPAFAGALMLKTKPYIKQCNRAEALHFIDLYIKAKTQVEKLPPNVVFTLNLHATAGRNDRIDVSLAKNHSFSFHRERRLQWWPLQWIHEPLDAFLQRAIATTKKLM